MWSKRRTHSKSTTTIVGLSDSTAPNVDHFQLVDDANVVLKSLGTRRVPTRICRRFQFSLKSCRPGDPGDLSPPAAPPSRQPWSGTPLVKSTLRRHPPLWSSSPSSSTVPVSHMHRTSPPSLSSQTHLTYIHFPAPQRALTLSRAPCNARRPSSSLSRARPIRFLTLPPPI